MGTVGLVGAIDGPHRAITQAGNARQPIRQHGRASWTKAGTTAA